MNFGYIVNYVILSVFLTLFTIELGIALFSILNYEKYKDRLTKYINPIWEVNGTFIIFYLVNFEATYPKLLPIVAVIYSVPVFIAFLFFLLRNSFLAYSGYVKDKRTEEICMRVYGVSTIVIALFAISILTSSFTGIGVNYQTNAINLFQMILNPFNVLALLTMILLALFVVGAYLELHGITLVSFVGLIVAIISLFLQLPHYINYSISSSLFIEVSAIVVALLIPIIIFLFRKSRKAAVSAVIWFIISINLFGILQYPNLFGGKQAFTSYLNNGAIGYYISLISIVCGAALVAAIAFLIYISYFKKRY